MDPDMALSTSTGPDHHLALYGSIGHLYQLVPHQLCSFSFTSLQIAGLTPFLLSCFFTTYLLMIVAPTQQGHRAPDIFLTFNLELPLDSERTCYKFEYIHYHTHF